MRLTLWSINAQNMSNRITFVQINLERSFLGQVGLLIGRVFPRFDAKVWQIKRDRHCKERMRKLSHLGELLPSEENQGRPVHLVVAAHHGPNAANWHVAGGNIGFETYLSAVEFLGEENVSLFGVEVDEPEASWHVRLLELMIEKEATHLLGQIENDPNQAENWSWDVLASVFERYWDGIFIGMMHDSAFEWLRLRTKRVGKIYSRVLYVDICEPVDGYVVPGRVEVGPVTMPMSQATVARIEEFISGCEKIHQVSFIGALYDYRVELIEALRADGFDVVVNPHRPDTTRDYLESRTNQPTYLEYMAGLAQSELTINFSLASGGPSEQYKIRVQEASLVGTLCVTDDKNRTRLFFDSNEYRFFESIESIEKVVKSSLSNPGQLQRDQQCARTRALELARNGYWGQINITLGLRKLRELV
jgi:hypothetical protein